MHRTLVIGSTGTIGREVLAQLSSAGVHVRAMARNPNAVLPLPGIEVVRGDLTVPETLHASLQGIDAVFLVWTAPAPAAGAALERITKQAQRIVYLSAPIKTAHPLVQASQPNPSSLLHAQIEQLIQSSGIEWTFLRPGMFAANALGWWAQQTRAGDVVRWPYLDVPTAPIDERDVAAVAVRALQEDGHAGAEYILTGPESLTHFDQISIIGRAIGRALRIEEMRPDELVRLWGGSPAANMLVQAWAAARGHPAFMTSMFQEVTGSAPRRFLQWAADHAAQFKTDQPAVQSTIA